MKAGHALGTVDLFGECSRSYPEMKMGQHFSELVHINQEDLLPLNPAWAAEAGLSLKFQASLWPQRENLSLPHGAPPQKKEKLASIRSDTW